jgi:hypothetical protein
MSESKALINLREAMAASVRKTQQAEVSGPSVIKFQQGRMIYQGTEIAGGELDVVVLTSTTERSFYDKPYDPDAITSPSCFAIGDNPKDLKPHENVKEPANPQCKDCPLAEFGTATQGKGPACKTYRRLAVIPASALATADRVASAEIASCKVSPTSVKTWSKYASDLVNTSGMPIWAAVTKMSNKPDNKTMQKQAFEVVSPVGEELILSALLGKQEEAEKLVAEPYDTETEEAAPKAKSKKY